MQLHILRGRRAALIAQSVAMTVEALERRTLLSGLTGTSPGFDVTDQLVFTSQPGNMTAAGKPFQVEVSAEDGAGKVDTSFNGPITVSDRYTNYYGSQLNGTLTVNAVNGVATFSDLTQEYATSNTYNDEYDALFASSGNLDVGQSSDFAIYQDQLVFLTQPPRDATAGSPFDIQIGAQDLSGNFDPTFSGIVVLSDLYSSYGYTLNGNQTVKAVNGIANFTGISQDIATNTPFGHQVGQDILFAYGYDSGMLNDGSNKFRILAANATQLVINGAPADTNGDMLTLTNAPLSLEVDAEDQFGNIDTSFNGGIALSLATDPTNATLGGTTMMAASKGVANFTDLVIDAAGEGYVIQASGLGIASSYPFSVTDQLVFTTQPTGDVFVGSTFNAVVEAEDGAGNIDSSFTGSVTLSDMYTNEYYASLDGNLTVNAVGGIATFTGLSQSLATANFYQNQGDVLYADSSDLAEAASNPFTILTPASQLLFASTPTDTDNALTLANAPLSVQVQAIDANGNVNTSFDGNITLALATNPANVALGGTTTVAAINGVATFTDLTIGAIGDNYTLLASGDGIGVSAVFSVTDQLVFTAQPPGTIVAGTPFGMVVEAQDGLGNVDTSFDGDVNLSDYYSNDYSNGTLNGTVSATAVGGIATFSGLTQTFATSSTYDGSSDVIFADSNGLPEGDSSNVIITGAAATQLVFLGTPANASGNYNTFSNAPLSVQVQAEDMYGNIADSFNGPVTVALGDGSPNGALGGTTTVNAVQGIASFTNITINEIGDGYTLVASGVPNASVISDTFSVTDQLVFTTQPPGTIFAGTSFNVVVAAEDGAGKLDTSFTGAVTLSDLYSYNYYNANLNGTLTVNAIGGVATFTGISQGFGTANTYQGESDNLYADSGGLPEASSANFVISSDQLAITTQPPSTVTAGSPFTVVVEADDSSGNRDTSFNGPITLSDQYSVSYGATLNGTLTVNAVNGVATFNGISQNSATLTIGAGPDVLFADGAGSAEADSNSFTINAAAATQLVFATTPTDTNGDGGIVANAPLSVQVQAQDQYGNVAADFNGSITLTLGNNPTGAILGGTTMLTATNGIANYNDLTISAVGNGYTLIANAQSSNTSLARAHSLTGVEFVIASKPKHSAP